MTDIEAFAARCIDLRDRRGLSAALVGRLFEVRDESLVAQVERATPTDIENLNRAHSSAMDFERSMRQVEDTLSTEPGEAIARLRTLADELGSGAPNAGLWCMVSPTR